MSEDENVAKCFVYAFEMSDSTVKIGMSNFPRQRKGAVERDYGLKVINSYYVEIPSRIQAFRVENELHRFFAARRVNGELFNITFAEACEALDKYKDLTYENIEYEPFPLEYKDQLVFTTKQLAKFYGSSRQSISTNFRYHINDFVEGVDYFYLCGSELKIFRFNYQKGDTYDFCSEIAPKAHEVYLWTISGAFKHSLYLNTDRANNVFISGRFFEYFGTDMPTEDFESPDQPVKQQPFTVENTPCDTRIELLMKLIDKCKDDNLRDTLIREAASLLLGEQI